MRRLSLLTRSTNLHIIIIIIIITGTHVPYRIPKCYLPPGRGDIPAFTPANYGWYSINDLVGCKAELT